MEFAERFSGWVNGYTSMVFLPFYIKGNILHHFLFSSLDGILIALPNWDLP